MESRPGERKPHILHVIPTLASGGAERLLLTNLSNATIRERFRHTIALTDIRDLNRKIDGTFLAGAFRDLDIELISLNRPGSKKLVGCIRALRRVIREKGVDLVHTHLGWANTAGQIAGRSMGKPVVTTFHSTAYSNEAREAFRVPRPKHSMLRRIDGFVTRQCMDQGIAVSRCVARHVAEYLYVDHGRIRVIHNPVDLKHIESHQADPRGYVRGLLGLPESARIVIEIARVLVSKGYMDLIQAFRSVATAHPDTHLVILGNQADAVFVRELRNRISELGLESRVHLVPPRLDVGDFLAASDVFAFPSKYEGLGNVLLEAMCWGLPCVCSDIEPFREIVRDGENGLMVPVGDIEALSAAILRILEDKHLAERLGTQAKIDIHKYFHPDRKLEELIDLYDHLL